jgi:hypothetical protein
MTWAITTPMPRTPLAITCFGDATISIAPSQRFDVMIDQLDDMQVVVNENEINLGNGEHVEYNTNYAYKGMPVLLKWLQSLSMEMPTFRA